MKMNKMLAVLALTVCTVQSSMGATEFSLSATDAPSNNGWTTVNNEFFYNSTDWALFGPGGNATYTIGDLNIGESVQIDFQIRNGVNNTDFVGVDFQDDGTTGIGFNFEGGTSNFGIFDGPGSGSTADSSIGFTTNRQTVKLTRTASTLYTLSIGSTDFTSLELANSTTTIDSIRVFNDTSGFENDVFFNNLQVIPEPSSILMMGLAGLAAVGVTLLKRRRKA
ncbi:MAG: PEP-CTERM sorting domain-containing protein [Kiritimatiellae bacterium]|jgi:hypothetical protein|nr:PEP-CTERM sorting domain-containing protein [Kiritimatiellia bacterium]